LGLYYYDRHLRSETVAEHGAWESESGGKLLGALMLPYSHTLTLEYGQPTVASGRMVFGI